MTEPDRPTPTTVVFDLGNVLIGWDQTGPLADRMSAEEWHSFAETADFPALNTAAAQHNPVVHIDIDGRHCLQRRRGPVRIRGRLPPDP